MNAAARIFLHIRALCRGVCVLNRSNNSLFMIRQSVFGHEGLSHPTCNMSWCTMNRTCGEGGVYFGGSWVTSCFSPLPRRGRGVAYSLHFLLLIHLCPLVVILTSSWLTGDLLPSCATITRKVKKPYRASARPSRSLGFTDNYHLHRLLQQAGDPWDPTGASQGFPVNPYILSPIIIQILIRTQCILTLWHPLNSLSNSYSDFN